MKREGWIGALLDEYERAATELADFVGRLPENDYERVSDPETDDPDCRSVRTILTHVVRAGFGYSRMLRREWGLADESVWPETVGRTEVADWLAGVVRHTEETFARKAPISEDEAAEVRIEARWGPVYDVEQLLEHAIVHLLRHRRQIERQLAADPRTDPA